MCGIVCGLTKEPFGLGIIQALAQLEYRGYDSAGIAVLNQSQVNRLRVVGKVAELKNAFESSPLIGECALAHTRWATHGKANELNAHPQVSHDQIAVVHNGIIENFEMVRAVLLEQGYQFTSETDTEVIAHAIHHFRAQGKAMQAALEACLEWFEGHYSFCVAESSEQIWAVCHGSPLVIGQSGAGCFIASDMVAMASMTSSYRVLEENDLACLTCDAIQIFHEGRAIIRDEKQLDFQGQSAAKGHYRHFMLKEIYEQPEVLKKTIQDRFPNSDSEKFFEKEGVDAQLKAIECVHIVACGTSYHAGLVAKYWFEEIAGVMCHVEVASEYRYRKPIVPKNTLFVTLSQSGETADTLAAQKMAKSLGYVKTLAICNVANSALARASDLVLLTKVGAEIGVASTKAFTSQLVVLSLLVHTLAECRQKARSLDKNEFETLFAMIAEVLAQDKAIEAAAVTLADKKSALFLGRHTEYPIAVEGALKLKEISYIHAEAYPSGELKHGPLALVDENMPIIILAPSHALISKIEANVQEVAARGGKLIIITDCPERFDRNMGATFIIMPVCKMRLLHPILYTIPLQLLAYHVALVRGTDIDQPRNLAKSVTVE